MAGEQVRKDEETFHEPSDFVLVLLLVLVLDLLRFMVTMHAIRRKKALHEPVPP